MIETSPSIRTATVPTVDYGIDGGQLLRAELFAPYQKGRGPVFEVALWDTGRTEHRVGRYSCPVLGYRLVQRRHEAGRGGAVVFEGEDFGVGCMTAIDSDEALASLMGFLTLRPGDTDAEHFEGYSEGQLDFCEHHAEALAYAVDSRFGEG
jgi:hypothetical protein